MRIKRNTLIKLGLLIIILIGGILSYNIYTNRYTSPYSQEYIKGQGNIQGDVNVDDYLKRAEEFEIGANAQGYAVFKNPNEAFKRLKADYKDGIKVIKEEFKLLPLTKLNYESYKVYGSQVTTGSKEEQEEAMFIASFMDIYENSFK